MGASQSFFRLPFRSPPKHERDEFDLAIIGAGPTGLLAAVLARQLNLDTIVLDAKDAPLSVGGADAITARTQQYLESASTTYADGEFTSRQPTWWNNIPHTFYNTLLMIGQPFIERHLASYLDIPVHYSEPVISLSHDQGPHQTAIIRTANRTIKAKYCLAADGAKSFVRNELGIGWEGTKPNMVWAVLDCWIESTFLLAKEIITLQIDGQSRMAWIPRERGMQRFYILLDGEITLEKAQAEVRRHMAPHPVEFTHIEWFSKFEIKERVASTFLYPTPAGPYILAGDSAHVHSVNGGQGMNTGLSDAFNLIWRIALLIKYPSLPLATQTALLKSYDTERRSSAKEVVDVAAKLVRSTTAEAKHYVELIQKNSGFITGMGVKYTGLESECVRESERSLFKAGERCPDLWLQEESGASSRLYQKLRYGRYLLLVIGNDACINKKFKGEFVTVIRLKPLQAKAIGVEKQSEKEDTHENAYRKDAFGSAYVKRDEEYLVLVRPDCYTEFVGGVDEVLQYFNERYPI
ncbi:FAD/NAD(P)-binding domain-containing protein [Periconia macrospinosa]|uniref:FAD/NAD(P)-binding domain-containing protein n=1 Tax=Periconia macrospinosa TaxID=97972 RepID=A0A2V1DJ34_9PLEO|nr:FAD/NAD(P)-binding domain-containing protein [Periconia macrospinosa]